LNNAIKQTEGKGLDINNNNFREFLNDKIKGVNFSVIKRDVERFLEDKNELKLLEKNVIMRLVDATPEGNWKIEK